MSFLAACEGVRHPTKLILAAARKIERPSEGERWASLCVSAETVSQSRMRREYALRRFAVLRSVSTVALMA